MAAAASAAVDAPTAAAAATVQMLQKGCFEGMKLYLQHDWARLAVWYLEQYYSTNFYKTRAAFDHFCVITKLSAPAHCRMLATMALWSNVFNLDDDAQKAVDTWIPTEYADQKRDYMVLTKLYYIDSVLLSNKQKLAGVLFKINEWSNGAIDGITRDDLGGDSELLHYWDQYATANS